MFLQHIPCPHQICEEGGKLKDINFKGTLSIMVIVCIYPTPPGSGARLIFKRSLTGLKSEFSFSLMGYHIKVEEHSLLCYLPIAGGRIVGFILFPRALALCEMQTVLSRIWTHISEFIFYYGNRYTTNSCKIVIVKNRMGVITSNPEWGCLRFTLCSYPWEN